MVSCYHHAMTLPRFGIGTAIATAVLAARALAPAAAAAPTFAADIAPIVYNHCATCHRPGQTAPFSLLSYDDVKRRGTLIVNATQRRYMPRLCPTVRSEFGLS